MTHPTRTTPASLVRTLFHTANRLHSAALSLRDGGLDDGIDVDKQWQRQRYAQETEERCRAHRDNMATAESYMAWESAARALDIAEGNCAWKTDNSTPISRAAGETDYNPQLIAGRLRELDEVRSTGDVGAMMRVIRTSLSRDLGGIGNADLYRHCHAGTKQLVERYVESFLSTIEAIVQQATIGAGATLAPTPTHSHTYTQAPSHIPSPDHVAPRHLLEELLYARQTFGRSALLLSGGGTFGMSHIGVVKSLFEGALLPRIISGASAGSIVCAVLCTRTDSEMPQLIRDFPYGDLSVFGDPNPDGDSGFLSHVRLLLTQGTWSDIRHLSRVMRNMMGDLTFQEAYNRTRRILNICVSSAGVYELPRLLNYVTAPNVMIWSAVAASCSVPLVFSAAPLLAKDPNTGAHSHWDPTPQSSWIDGSVDNDLPMTRLSEMFNVNHFIVSQVNPHVAPFLPRDDGNVDPTNTLSPRPSAAASEWKGALTSLARDEVLHRLHFLAELGILPNVMTKLRSVLSQRYSGDINILPELALSDLPHILSNPTSEFMVRVCLLGERATWPKLSRIRDRCAIELALDRAVHRVRAHILFSSRRLSLLPMPTVKTPITLGTTSTTSDKHLCAAETPSQRRRHRRLSGCSAQLVARGNRFLVPTDDAVTDRDTDEEERSVMHLRHGAGVIYGTPAGRHRHKVRLKRAFRSHINIGQLHVDHSRHAPVTAPISSAVNTLEQGLEFNFAHAATPGPQAHDEDGHVSSALAMSTAASPSRSGRRLFSPTPTHDTHGDFCATDVEMGVQEGTCEGDTDQKGNAGIVSGHFAAGDEWLGRSTRRCTAKASRESLVPSVHQVEHAGRGPEQRVGIEGRRWD
jgi:TAG lipase/steryl ester hydrolase/phospholipase A2/LPA acyltransferase